MIHVHNGRHPLKTRLFATLFATVIASLACGMPQAVAQTAAASTPSKSVKKAPPKKPVTAKENIDADDEEHEPDISGSSVTEFQCELGNRLAIYRNSDDDQHIALRWNKRLHRLTRIETSTGAHRFENRNVGLVWIGIPAKGMLLDSKKGRQLANECKSAEQMMTKPAEAIEKTKS